MAAGKLFVVLGFAVLAIAAAGVARRDAPTTNDQVVTEFFNNAEKTWKETTQSLAKLFGFDNTEQASQKAKEEGQKAIAQLDKFAVLVQDSTADFQNNPIVKDLTDSANKLKEDWKSKHPETAADVEKLGQDTQAVLDKLNGLAKSEQAENIKKLANELWTKAAETIGKISTETTSALKH